MAKETEINIHQCLHGYKSGHKLLSSSADLAESEKRFMLAMSDYSGSGVEKGFSEYITGYPIPGSKFYVFAKTWYADEMARPGCVWTHSFLIDVTDLWQIKDMRVLLPMFRRPYSIVEQFEYSSSLNVAPNSMIKLEYEHNAGFYKISCELYDTAEKGLVIIAESSNEFESEILDIWNCQWPRMKRSFTFSTGSLSLRNFENEPFDLQVFPIRRERGLAIGEKNKFNTIKVEDIKCDNNWIAEYREVNFNDLKNYMVNYGADVSGTRVNFIPLFLSYKLLQDVRLLNVTQTDIFFQKNFVASNQAQTLKAFIVSHLLSQGTDTSFSVLKLLLHNKTLAAVKWDFSKIILPLYFNGKLSPEELIAIVRDLYQAGHESDILSLLKIIDIAEWGCKLSLDEAVYEKLVEFSPQYEREVAIWENSLDEQEKWFSAFRKNDNTNWEVVIGTMLNANADQFVIKAFEFIGISIVEYIVNWIAQNGKAVSNDLLSIIRAHAQQSYMYMLPLERYNKQILRLALDIFSSKDDFWVYIPYNSVEDFFFKVKNSRIEPECTGICTTLLTLCYENKLSDSAKVNCLLFQYLHDNFQNNIIEFSSWDRFRSELRFEISGLIQQSYLSNFFLDKNRIPEWDHCEFLRRSLIAAFIKYKWEPTDILEAIKDKKTFEQIVNFGSQVNEGYYIFKNLLYQLGHDKNDSYSFHYKILKKAIDNY